MAYYFTSDYHLGHENIIKYTKRPFKSLYHMNSTIIKNHNEIVKNEDTVFFLGDFCFKNSAGGKPGEGELEKAEHYIKQLNGRLVFIRGNHDNNNSLKTCMESAVIHLGGKDIYLCHNPKDINPGYSLAFCGHVHEKWKFKQFGKTDVVNVGCDVWDFKPIDFEEIWREYQKWLKTLKPEKRKT